MNDVLIVIPARMASTRLPGKPLADIAGQPMIVHVLRRAQAAAIGPVVVATDSPEIEAAVRQAGGRAVMTRPDHGSGTDRICRGARPGRSGRQGGDHRQPAGRRSDARSCRSRGRPGAARRPGRRHRHARGRDRARRGARRPERRQGGGHARFRRASARALLHPGGRAGRRRGRSITTSASTPSAVPRSSASSRCRPRSWRSASSSSNCARSRPACASTWRWSSGEPLTVDTPEDLARARAVLTSRS